MKLSDLLNAIDLVPYKIYTPLLRKNSGHYKVWCIKDRHDDEVARRVWGNWTVARVVYIKDLPYAGIYIM